MIANLSPVARASLFFLTAFVLWGMIEPEGLSQSMQGALGVVIRRFGWFYLLSLLCFLAFSIYLAFSRFRHIRIGGASTRPEFSRSSWFAMLFAAGMGIGLVFWGAAEPISHFGKPPLGLESGTPEAARMALRYSFFHWGLHPWAAYCLIGLALGVSHFNRKLPLLVSSTFQPLFGHRARGWLGHSVDTLALIATIFGVATSLGLGTLQIAAGIEHLFGLKSNILVQLLIVATATALYLLSSMSGLSRGIKLLSNTNLVIAVLLMGIVFVLGPTAFILEALTTTLGDYLNNLISMSTRLTPFSKGEWVANWTLFYWAWWVAWAPFVGMFIARISRGRTLQEFIMGVLLVPALASFVWFSVFGGTALFLALFEGIPLVEITQKDISMTLFVVLEWLPGGFVWALVSLFLIVIFFITSADSATFVVSVMASSGNPSPPQALRLIWGTLIALIAVVLLLSGGLSGLQTMSILSALPFMALMLLMCLALYRALEEEYQIEQRISEERERALDQLLEKK